MEIYDTEEEQLAAIKAWWKENGQATLIGLAVGIAVILGWKYWQDYKKNKAEQASALYGELLKSLANDKKDSVGKLAERLQAEFSATDYAAYSALIDAKIKIQQGNFAAAKQILEKVAATANEELSNIAKIRLVRLMLANKEYEQGLKLINDIDPASSTSFSGHYDELVGDLYVALERPELARTSFQNASRSGYQSPFLQLKIDDLTAPEKVESKK